MTPRRKDVRRVLCFGRLQNGRVALFPFPRRAKRGAVSRLTWLALLLWSLFLLGAGAAVARLARPLPPSGVGGSAPSRAPGGRADALFRVSEGPWGELETTDIQLDQPMEYVAFEDSTPKATFWRFQGIPPAEARALMAGCGLSNDQIEAALAGSRVVYDGTTTVVTPGEELVLSLDPSVRERLYALLARWPENTTMRQPYHLAEGDFSSRLARSGVDAESIRRVGALLYRRGGNALFSDVELVLRHLPAVEDRLVFLKSLSLQTATLANLRLRPGCDIDKILGYWAGVPGVRAKDLRPLLESIRDAPDGGSLNIIYLLPPFARSRLYTFPMPAEEGDGRGDCHWSALNFHHDPPDDRLMDAAYASERVRADYYPIGRPSRCGDLVFLLDGSGGVIHSAVHLADDLVFTKNGINVGQPWILMRMSRLLKVYTFGSEPKVVFYRRRES